MINRKRTFFSLFNPSLMFQAQCLNHVKGFSFEALIFSSLRKNLQSSLLFVIFIKPPPIERCAFASHDRYDCFSSYRIATLHHTAHLFSLHHELTILKMLWYRILVDYYYCHYLPFQINFMHLEITSEIQIYFNFFKFFLEAWHNLLDHHLLLLLF